MYQPCNLPFQSGAQYINFVLCPSSDQPVEVSDGPVDIFCLSICHLPALRLSIAHELSLVLMDHLAHP